MKILDVPQSGSVAGVTSSRNRYGQYRRTRAIPVNPQTNAQQTVRTRMADVATAWRNLDPEERAAWEATAATIARTDSLGQTYYMTGAQCFSSFNLMNLAIGSSIVDVPPVSEPTYTGSLPTLTSVVTAGVLAMSASLTGGAAGNSYMVFASPPCSAGKTYPPSFKQLAVDTGDNFPLDIHAAYTATFGVPPVGSKVFVKIVEVSASQAGPPLIGSVITTAGA